MDPDSIPPGACTPQTACAVRFLVHTVQQKGGRP